MTIIEVFTNQLNELKTSAEFREAYVCLNRIEGGCPFQLLDIVLNRLIDLDGVKATAAFLDSNH